jgi:DNA polymerase I-like protein with 3'-5' exonuclease and polymerase domains
LIINNFKDNKIYYYLDIETTTEGGVDNKSPEAQWKTNKILAFYCHVVNPVTNFSVSFTDVAKCLKAIRNVAEGNSATPVIVAHNAKFDIKWLIREAGEGYPWHKVDVWDTMTAEYYVSGHMSKFMSIEKCNGAYGIVAKKTINLKEHFDSGLTMRDIPEDKLREYVTNDTLMLVDLHQAQIEYAVNKNIQVPDMSYIIVLAMMELNGLPVHIHKACVLAQQKITAIEKHMGHLRCEIANRFRWKVTDKDGNHTYYPINIDEDFCAEIGTKSKTIKAMANRTLSMLLTGKPRVVKITPKWHLQVVDPISNAEPSGKKANHLGYPMDEAVLKELAHLPSYGLKEIINEDILPYRKANKLLSTYLMPMLASAKLQGHIYPKLHTTSTATGRLSSSHPNGQNMPKVIRELIRGPMVEVDFKQLEIHIAAAITGDPQLREDLKNGLDVHEQTAKASGTNNRKLAKQVNFGILYGAGKAGLAKQTGEPIGRIGKLIEAFYNRYPGVKRWQQNMMHMAKGTAVGYEFHGGGVRRKFDYVSPTGRMITIPEQKAPDWQKNQGGGDWSFSPQQLSNYPIQSMAGGTVVLEFMTQLFQGMPFLNWRMTVHDSILFDMPNPKDLTRDELDAMIKGGLKLFINARPDWNIPSLGVDITYHDEHWS